MSAEYTRGYLDALIETSWTCSDCGNRYEAGVEECPNRYTDRSAASLRFAQSRPAHTCDGNNCCMGSG